MKRPCHCNRAIRGVPFAKPQCHLCWTAMNRPEYAILWGVDPETLEPMTPEQLAARPKSANGDCCGGELPYKVELSS